MLAKNITSRCFEKGLIVEIAGRNSTVIKILPPLVIDIHTLQKGCSIIKEAFDECILN